MATVAAAARRTPEVGWCEGSAPGTPGYAAWLMNLRRIREKLRLRLAIEHGTSTFARAPTPGECHVSIEDHVRISGFLMLDPEHMNHMHEYRGHWEIQPITRIEVFVPATGWTDLDDLPR
jgi:hypothetical protein